MPAYINKTVCLSCSFLNSCSYVRANTVEGKRNDVLMNMNSCKFHTTKTDTERVICRTCRQLPVCQKFQDWTVSGGSINGSLVGCGDYIYYGGDYTRVG